MSNIFKGLVIFSSFLLFILFQVDLIQSKDTSFYRSSTFILYKDRYLAGHVIFSKFISSTMECSMECNIFDGCESWNMQETGTSNEYLCELNNADGNTKELLMKERSLFAQKLSIPTKKTIKASFLFTTLGSNGKTGPTDVSGYHGTSLAGQVTLDNGSQIWKVPYAGTYQIEVCGASGANGTCTGSGTEDWRRGGLGANVKGTFFLSNGTILRVLIGQAGTMGTSFADRPGGGGGGTFVTNVDNIPLIIAGGGGGGAGCSGLSGGDKGQEGTHGSQCQSVLKQGGETCFSGMPGMFASGGGGLLGDGQGTPFSGPSSFSNGGTGGDSASGSYGGFGGGGFGWTLGGGGGGYSGGGVWGNSSWSVSGGGGSYNDGREREFGVCAERGNGKVFIELIG